MEDFGYDFRFININSLPEEPDQKIKKCRRKVYVRYECDNCNEDGKPKRWTSILGVFQIQFCFQDLDLFLIDYPQFAAKEKNRKTRENIIQMLIWRMKIYREKCKECGHWGYPYIYESQLRACLMDFGRVVANILDGIKPNRNIGNRFKIQENHNHH